MEDDEPRPTPKIGNSEAQGDLPEGVSVRHAARRWFTPAGPAPLIGAALLLLVLEVLRSVEPRLVPLLALWVAAILLGLLHARAVDSRRHTVPVRWFSDRGEVVAVAGVTVLAAALRLIDLGDLPSFTHHDIAACGQLAKNLLAGTVHDPFRLSWYYLYTHVAALPYAASIGLLGTSMLSIRLATAIPGIVAVPAIYYLVRGWYGRVAALAAAVLLAANHVAVHFSRTGIWNMHAVLLVLVSAAALFTGLRRHSRLWLALAGVASGLALYTYTAGRLALGLAVVALVAHLARTWRLRDLGAFAAFAVGLLITIEPLVASYVRQPRAVAGDRTATVSPFAGENRDHVLATVGTTDVVPLLVHQVRGTLSGFCCHGDTSSHYTAPWPLIGPMTLVLAVVGLGLLIWRWRREESLYLAAWIIAALLFGSVLALNPPSFPRMLVVVPAVLVLAAATLGELWRLGKRDRRFREAAAALVAVIAVISLASNVVRYLRYCRVADLRAGEWDVLQATEGLRDFRTVYLFTGPTLLPDSPTLELFRGDRRFVYGLTAADFPGQIAEPTAFVVMPAYRLIGPALTERFPDLDRVAVDREGRLQVTLYRFVPRKPGEMTMASPTRFRTAALTIALTAAGAISAPAADLPGPARSVPALAASGGNVPLLRRAEATLGQTLMPDDVAVTEGLEMIQGQPWPFLQDRLVALASSPDRYQRGLALESLATINATGHREVFVSALSSRYRNVRVRALRALATIHDPAVVEPLASTLVRDPDPDLRALAALALAQTAPGSALNRLRRAVEDPSPVVRDAAVRALVAGGDPELPARLIAGLENAPPERVLEFIRLLSFVSDPAVDETLGRRLDDPDPVVRVAAATALLRERPQLR